MAKTGVPKERGASPLNRLRDVWHEAEQWPLAGGALRRVQDAEIRALSELKYRLAALDSAAASPDTDTAPACLLADLLAGERRIDPDRARDDLYRRILRSLLSDEVAMLRVLAARRIAPLCHIAGARLPAGGRLSVVCIRNTTSLGQEAGVLLREYVPYYMSHLITLGLAIPGPENSALEADYDLLLADSLIRHEMQIIREEHRLYPRILRRSVALSALGQALWQDCFPAARALDESRPTY